MSNEKYTIQDFKSVVEFTRDMIASNNIRLIMPSESLIRLRVLNEEAIIKFAEKSKISKEYIMFLLEIDIPRYIIQILEDIPLEINNNGKALSEEEKKETENKAKIVNDILIDSSIKNMHLIKSTSKVDMLYAVDWEINKKIFDDTKGNIPELKFATLNIRLSKPSYESNPVAKLFNFSEQSSKVCINCDLSDVENLIDILNDIKKAMIDEEGAKS